MAEPTEHQSVEHEGRAGALVPRQRVSPLCATGDGFAADAGPSESAAPTTTGPGPLSQLLRYKWTMVLVALFAAGAGLAGVWTLVMPKYRASAMIEVHPTKQIVAFNTEDNGVVPFYQQYLFTQIRKLQSPKVIQRVLAHEEVRQSAWLYGEPTTFLDRVLEPSSPEGKLSDALEVGVEPGSSLIEVAVNARNPHDAAAVANAIVDEYLKTVYQEKREQDHALNQKRRDREAALLEDIRQLEHQAEQYKQRLKVLTPEELVTSRRIRLDELLAKRDELELGIKNARATLRELEALQAERPERPEEEDEPGALYPDDAVWARLYEELQTVRLELQMAGDEFGDAHPTMVRLRKRAAFLNERLRDRERTLDTLQPLRAQAPAGSNQASASVTLTPSAQRWRIKELENQSKNLQALIARQSAEFDDTFDYAEALDKKLREITYKRELYDTVKRQRDTRDIERFAPASIEKEATAFAPATPDNDPRKKLSLAALLGAILAGIAVAYGRALLNSTVQEPAELSSATAAPFLGMLPLLRHPEMPRPLEESIQSECVRMVRTALLQRLDGDGGAVVQITSAGPATGKTTFALMLARSLAQCGKTVLLVDADLRNPSVAKRMSLNVTSPGLIQSITSEAADSETILPTSTAGLSVLAAGRPASPSESEQLANGKLPVCLNRWRQQYDLVLLDSSPLLPVADARILARHADGTILLVREGHCRHRDVVDSLACLTTAGGELLGTVFTSSRRVSSYSSGYYYDNYTGVPAEGTDTLDVRAD